MSSSGTRVEDLIASIRSSSDLTRPDQILYRKSLMPLSGAGLDNESRHRYAMSSWTEASLDPKSDYHWQCRACQIEYERRGLPERFEQVAFDYDCAVYSGAHKPLPSAVVDGESRKVLPIQVCHNENGFYLGALRPDGSPFSRESEEFWSSAKEAQAALDAEVWSSRRQWTRRYPDLPEQSEALTHTSVGLPASRHRR